MNGKKHPYLAATVNMSKATWGASKASLEWTKLKYARMTEREAHWFSVAGKGIALYYLWYYGPFVVEHEWVLFILLSALIAPKAFEKIVEIGMGSKAAIAGAVGDGVRGLLRRSADKVVDKVESDIDKAAAKLGDIK